VLERVVEDISFEGPDLPNKNVVIDAAYVRGRLQEILEKEDLSRFIL
jgi:ATP-dependent HslUV protease ATP-binding subunit HslU